MQKKLKTFLKNIKLSKVSFTIGLIIGVIISATGVYAATSIYSNKVTYDNSSSGLSATNVQDALDETYKKCIPSAVEKVINLYNDGSTINTVHIAGDTSKPRVSLNSTQGIMVDDNGNYRYYGANPNNYVTFNGELWRIIGAFNNVDDGTGKKETRLKIIRNESIGSYSYDSSASTVNSGYGVNDWSKADLNTELNSLYYNSTSGTCYNGQSNAMTTCDFTDIGLKSDFRNMITDAIYYLGGSSSSELYSYEYYNLEMGTNVYNCSTNDGACPRVISWKGKISLIYISDYLYATNLSLCKKNGYNYANDISCYSNDWLFTNNYQLTIDSSTSTGYHVLGIFTSGFVGRSYVSDKFEVKPVLYLKSNVAISGGTGTSSNPYTLKLP